MKVTHDCINEPEKCREAEATEQKWVWEGLSLWIDGDNPDTLHTIWLLCDLEDGKPLRVRVHRGKDFETDQTVDLFLLEDGTFSATDEVPSGVSFDVLRNVSEWSALNIEIIKDHWNRKVDGADFDRLTELPQ